LSKGRDAPMLEPVDTGDAIRNTYKVVTVEVSFGETGEIALGCEVVALDDVDWKFLNRDVDQDPL
jgi:hypothetical protein